MSSENSAFEEIRINIREFNEFFFFRKGQKKISEMQIPFSFRLPVATQRMAWQS